MLNCSQRIAGNSYNLATVPYDPAEHRWLRLRDQAEVLYWEVSADGCEWVTLARNGNPLGSQPGGPASAVTLELGAGVYQALASPGVAIFDNVNTPEARRARRVDERRLSAREVREEAAALAAARRHDEHANNNDEVNYPTRPLVGNYSKSLKHDSLGDPDPASYGTLLRALESRDPQDFEEIQLAPPNPSVAG